LGDDAVRHPLLTTTFLALTLAGTLIGDLARAGGDTVTPGPVFVPPPPPQPVFVPPVAPVASLLPQVATSQATSLIVTQLNEATEFCSAIGNAAYVIDCLSERLAVIEETMPETGEYAEAREVIGLASRGLRLLVDESPSADLPDGIARSTGADARQTNRPLRAVSTESLEETLLAAANIIDEAETLLLRSSASPEEIHYQRVAEAMGSNKILLRSL